MELTDGHKHDGQDSSTFLASLEQGESTVWFYPSENGPTDLG